MLTLQRRMLRRRVLRIAPSHRSTWLPTSRCDCPLLPLQPTESVCPDGGRTKAPPARARCAACPHRSIVAVSRSPRNCRVTAACCSYLALGRAHDALRDATQILNADGNSYKALLLQGNAAQWRTARIADQYSGCGTPSTVRVGSAAARSNGGAVRCGSAMPGPVPGPGPGPVPGQCRAVQAKRCFPSGTSSLR